MKKLIVILAMLLVSCAPAQTLDARPTPMVDDKYNTISTYLNYNIVRVIDYDAGWVCWSNYGNGGIFCVPIEQTNLPREKR